MEFRLIYEGPLRAEDRSGGAAGRAKDKHELRKHFHLQLRELWKQHPNLRMQAETKFVVTTTPDNMVSPPGPNVRQINPILPDEVYRKMNVKIPPEAKTWLEHIADDSHTLRWALRPTG